MNGRPAEHLFCVLMEGKHRKAPSRRENTKFTSPRDARERGVHGSSGGRADEWAPSPRRAVGAVGTAATGDRGCAPRARTPAGSPLPGVLGPAGPLTAPRSRVTAWINVAAAKVAVWLSQVYVGVIYKK